MAKNAAINPKKMELKTALNSGTPADGGSLPSGAGVVVLLDNETFVDTSMDAAGVVTVAVGATTSDDPWLHISPLQQLILHVVPFGSRSGLQAARINERGRDKDEYLGILNCIALYVILKNTVL